MTIHTDILFTFSYRRIIVGVRWLTGMSWDLSLVVELLRVLVYFSSAPLEQISSSAVFLMLQNHFVVCKLDICGETELQEKCSLEGKIISAW